MKFQNIQAVLFDLDGTLIDSAPDLGAAVDKMRVDRGMSSLPLAHYRPMAGAGARGMIALAFGYTPDHPDYEAMKEEFFRNYESCMTERTFAFEGVAQMIAALVAAKLPWGVVTNKSKRLQNRSRRPCRFLNLRPSSFAATPHHMPSLIQNPCWKLQGGWA
jgi:phosphoglycolate phosphatase-like HAD superfamily hydrolase